MSDRRPKGEFVLCIYPSAKGFGYAVFENSQSLVDWGVKGVHGERKNAQSLRKVRELLAFYRPDVLVTEDYKGAGSRRGSRIRELIDAIGALAAKESVASRSFSRAEVRNCFGLTAKRADRAVHRSGVPGARAAAAARAQDLDERRCAHEHLRCGRARHDVLSHEGKKKRAA